MRVVIPFWTNFEEKMLSGQKTVTSRTKKYGSPGDVFAVFGADFEITRVETLTLEELSRIYLREEGFETVEELKECWNMLHPRHGWDPDQWVHAHSFKRIDVDISKAKRATV